MKKKIRAKKPTHPWLVLEATDTYTDLRERNGKSVRCVVMVWRIWLRALHECHVRSVIDDIPWATTLWFNCSAPSPNYKYRPHTHTHTHWTVRRTHNQTKQKKNTIEKGQFCFLSFFAFHSFWFQQLYKSNLCLNWDEGNTVELGRSMYAGVTFEYRHRCVSAVSGHIVCHLIYWRTVHCHTANRNFGQDIYNHIPHTIAPAINSIKTRLFDYPHFECEICLPGWRHNRTVGPCPQKFSPQFH